MPHPLCVLCTMGGRAQKPGPNVSSYSENSLAFHRDKSRVPQGVVFDIWKTRNAPPLTWPYNPLNTIGSVGVSAPPAFSIVTPKPCTASPAGASARIIVAFPALSGANVPAGKGFFPSG